MNLADELLGLKPRKTASGRVVCNDDPPEDDLPEVVESAAQRLAAWVDAQEGIFSPLDICADLGLERKRVASYLGRLKDKGVIRKVGQMPGAAQKSVFLWRKS